MIALHQLPSCVFCSAPEFLDGSAYVNHVELVRKVRGEELPESFWTDPLMYQGSSQFLGPNDPIRVTTEDYGIDFEAEIGVIVDDVPMGVSIDEAVDFIKYFVLINDISLRNLIPKELAKGFGFLHGKPQSALSPFVVLKDGLGDAWDGKRIHLPLVTKINGKQFGKPDAGIDMIFDFPTLIAHAAKTRPLKFRTIIGSGTVSNKKGQVGHSCIAEKRMIETIKTGKPSTSFLKFGDVVKIEMFNKDGESIFGAIEQEVTKA